MTFKSGVRIIRGDKIFKNFLGVVLGSGSKAEDNQITFCNFYWMLPNASNIFHMKIWQKNHQMTQKSNKRENIGNIYMVYHTIYYFLVSEAKGGGDYEPSNPPQVQVRIICSRTVFFCFFFSV